MEPSEIKVELTDDEDLKLITMINNQDVDGINKFLDTKRQGKLISDIVRVRSNGSFLHRNASSLMNFYFNRFPAINGQIYMNKDGNKIKSCWKLNRITGLIGLDQKKLKEWEERINSLVEQINYWIKNSTEKTVEIVELFY
jgi:hypothetical protein